MVSVKFYPFGFSVKELATRNIFLRSNSNGDIYPFQSTHGASIPSSTSSAFSILSSSIWHSRLDHLGNAILNSLSSSNSIKCNKIQLLCVILVLWVNMLNCLSFILNLLVLVPLRFFIVIYGLHRFRVLRATNIILVFLTTKVISCGLSHYFANLKFMIYL